MNTGRVICINIQVYSKYLERFLYAHEILFVNSYRTYDGAVVWEYTPDDFTQHVIGEWQEVQQRRQHRLDNQTKMRNF